MSDADLESTPIQSDGRLMRIEAEAVYLDGILNIPEGAPGLILLAHGLDDTLMRPRQNVIALARALNKRGLATLQVDLFSSDERQLDQQTGFFRQNINIMQQRLIGAAEWFLEHPATERLSIGYLGLNEVGAAVLAASAERPDIPAALIAIGSHLNLARDYVHRILAPAFIIAVEHDDEMLQANHDLFDLMTAKKQFDTIPTLSSLFEDQPALDNIVSDIGDWYTRWLVTLP